MPKSYRSPCVEANPPDGTNFILRKHSCIWMRVLFRAWLRIKHSARERMGAFNARPCVPIKGVHQLEKNLGLHKIAKRAAKPTVLPMGAHNGHVMVVVAILENLNFYLSPINFNFLHFTFFIH